MEIGSLKRSKFPLMEVWWRCFLTVVCFFAYLHKMNYEEKNQSVFISPPANKQFFTEFRDKTTAFNVFSTELCMREGEVFVGSSVMFLLFCRSHNLQEIGTSGARLLIELCLVYFHSSGTKQNINYYFDTSCFNLFSSPFEEETCRFV